MHRQLQAAGLVSAFQVASVARAACAAARQLLQPLLKQLQPKGPRLHADEVWGVTSSTQDEPVKVEGRLCRASLRVVECRKPFRFIWGGCTGLWDASLGTKVTCRMEAHICLSNDSCALEPAVTAPCMPTSRCGQLLSFVFCLYF